MCGMRQIISVIISETSNSPFICARLVEDSLAFDTLKNYFNTPFHNPTPPNLHHRKTQNRNLVPLEINPQPPPKLQPTNIQPPPPPQNPNQIKNPSQNINNKINP